MDRHRFENEEIENIHITELTKILEYSYDGIWIMDGNGKILTINKAYERISGVPIRELVGLNVGDVVQRGYISHAAYVSVIEKKESISIMQSLKNGKQVLITASPVFDDEGNLWRIISNVRDITELNELRRELEDTKKQYKEYEKEIKKLRQERDRSSEIVAYSLEMKKILQLAEKLSAVDSNILILGESGVGKGVIAEYFHHLSKRSQGPMIKVNCGAIPENLLESELFGFEKGSFTGASATGKKGMFELAQHGTIFLDEIGELPLNLQVKLLRALQDREIYRVGGVTPIKLDVRIISATNRDLLKMMQEGSFRKDLYYRLNVIPITIPPLRERKEDIAPLIYFFLIRYNKKYGKNYTISPEELNRLVNYEWFGNVREMENMLERMVVMEEPLFFQTAEDAAQTFQISNEKEDPAHISQKFAAHGSLNMQEIIEQLEKTLLEEALKKYGSIRKASKSLGLNHATAIRKIKRYGLSKSGLI